ncbi:MAG: RNA chaperone Hfq [Clostridiales bacterium]|nr:RNA chaperone Hfq [Clostridiales bacterium]
MIKTAILNKSTEMKDSSLYPRKAKPPKKHIAVSWADTTRTPIHVHDIFLNICRKELAEVEIVLKSGEIINGIIDIYDQDTIVVHNDMAQILVYKHSISYLSPRNGKSMVEPDRQIAHYSKHISEERKTVNA